MEYCKVLIEEGFLFNEPLTYACAGYDVQFGVRVWVNVRNRRMMGFVVDVFTAEPDTFSYAVKPIDGVIDQSPIINHELFQLAEKMSVKTVSPLIRCLQTILPNKLRPRTTSQKPKKELGLRFIGLDDQKLTPKQKAFIEAFKEEDFVSLKKARKHYSNYNALIKRNIFEKIEREVRYEHQTIENHYPKHKLTKVQEDVYHALKLNKSHTYLLHGVTGSGKTELYLQWAESVLQKGKSVLFLVPEIALTPQMIERVSSRFKEDVAIYHSSLNDQEKYEQYLRIKNNETQIVVGTRSAVFMPFEKLGLIILDEEHDTSYKQSHMPMYHTLDIAEFRSRYHNCPLVLGSASPRLESYARGLRGLYTLLELPHRINESFPTVNIIDTQQALMNRESSLLTDELVKAIALRLKRREQVILILNRRGYMTFLKDKNTQEVLMCPHCDVSLNYHKFGNVLKCHQCDYQTKEIPKGKDGQPLEIVGSGVGTQRLQEQLQKMFENARIGRMDRDTTSRKHAHEKILSDFNQHKYDILVGTQMIAKGLDIPNVTLVGILNIDTALAHEDFRSVEETFGLILQAAGRSGRGDKKGEVIIQTFNPDHYAINYAVHNKYKSFFKQEMQYRKLAKYPPYSYLISIVFSDKDESMVIQDAMDFLAVLDDDGMSIMGPSLLYKLKDMHRSRIILKGIDLSKMIEAVYDAYQIIDRKGVRIDVNPMSLV